MISCVGYDCFETETEIVGALDIGYRSHTCDARHNDEAVVIIIIIII